ncbi:MAG TPA: ABC transporter permease [Polyangiaceae bacterium]|jgi:peptide/nickel transport system permease protein
MIKRALKRIAWALLVVWATTTITFFINNVLPSDPARMVAGAQARPKDVERVRQQLGLDKPVLEQYGRFMRRLVHFGPSHPSPKDPAHATCANLGPVHFDLGKSYQQRRAVTTILGERLPRTVLLAFAAILIETLLGIITGLISAVKRNTAVDHFTVSASLVGISAPTFIIGLALQFVLAHQLRLLPLDGFGDTWPQHLVSLVLPALTLGIYGAAYYTRVVRDELIGAVKMDHVRTARAKGLPMWRVWLRHALRNALVPLVTLVGLDLGALVGGAIVTETLFRWPGLGALSVSALLDRDGPVIMGTVIVSSAGIVLANLLVDLSYAILDPRVRR